MKANVIYWNGMVLCKDEAWKLYQELCNEVFGKDVVVIYPAPMNVVTAHLKFAVGMVDFKAHLKGLLERLYEKMKDEALWELVDWVEKVADPMWCEEAYANLVAWDVMWDYYRTGMIGIEGFAAACIADVPQDANPFDLSDETKDQVLQKMAFELVDEERRLAVLVKAPWNYFKCFDSDFGDFVYYFGVALGTFLQPEKEEYSEKVAGLVVIDETCGDAGEVKTVCHAFLNPKREVTEDEMFEVGVLKDVVEKGNDKGMFVERF